MSLVKLDTGFNIEIDFAIAPFHKRLFAWVIDLFLLIAYFWLMSKIFYTSYTGAVITITSIPAVFYYLICEVTLNGQTIGKKAMNIQVIALDGGQPTISQYLIRWMFRFIDLPTIVIPAIIYGQLPWWCMALLFTGIGCIIISPNSQRVGDLVAGTIIIDKRNRTSWQDTVFTEIEATYRPKFSQV